MALLKRTQKAEPLVTLRNELAALLTPSASTFTNVVSVENFQAFATDPTSVSLGGSIETVANEIQSAFHTSFENLGTAPSTVPGFSGKTFTDSQMSAAAMVALALRTPETARAYHAAALNCTVSAEKVAMVIEPSSNPLFGYRSEYSAPKDCVDVSLEAFDARNLEQLRAFNTVFAFSAAIQDEFAEAFFPTVTLSPDSTGLEVSIRRTMVQQEIRHLQTGEVIDWKQRNLLDAITDTSILINEATRIYPCVEVNNAKSEKHFVAKTIIAPVASLGGGGTPIMTAPLAADVKVDLLGIGQTSNQFMQGRADQTDALDHAIKVEALYFRITTGTVGNTATSIIRFNTKQFKSNGFLKSNEGRSRRVSLDFPTHGLQLTGETEDYVTKNPATALAFLNAAPYDNVALNLETLITGEGDLQFGTISVSARKATIANARIVNGPNDYETITDETVLDALDALLLNVEFLGYDVKAYYANTNKRFLGTILDSVEERVRYVVPLSPPISVQTPITGTATATDMAGPMNAQRVVNSINAVTKILENVETLTEVVGQVSYANSDETIEIEGFGRLIVRPTLFRDTLNIANVLSSVSSSNRTADVQAAIVNKLRYGIAHIYTESRLQPAIDSINGTAGERPKVVIGADPKVASYIMVNGDPRVLGLGFETQVVVTYDNRFRNKVYASFVRNKTGEVDVLSHGAFAYIPELVTQAQIPFNGSITNVTQVQNRNLHVVFLPVALYLEIEGLELGASGLVELPVRI